MILLKSASVVALFWVGMLLQMPLIRRHNRDCWKMKRRVEKFSAESTRILKGHYWLIWKPTCSVIFREYRKKYGDDDLLMRQNRYVIKILAISLLTEGPGFFILMGLIITIAFFLSQ